MGVIGHERTGPSAEIFFQGCTRVPSVARGRLPACSLAQRDPVAPTGRPRRQRRGQGREEAPCFPGVADAQSVRRALCSLFAHFTCVVWKAPGPFPSRCPEAVGAGTLRSSASASAQVLTAPEADPHPLEVPVTPRAAGESRAALHAGCDTPGLPSAQGAGQAPWGPALSHGDTCLVFLSCCLPRHGGVSSRSTQVGLARVEKSELKQQSGTSHWFPAPVPPPILLALCLLQLVSESCPRLSFLKLSDCHGVTPDTLTMLARACPQLHSLDVQHSMVSPVSPGALKQPRPR